MRKHVESLKTFVLFMLVVISLFLSFNIWTFRLDYETIENEKYIEKVTVGEKKNINEVIVPKGVFMHLEGNHHKLKQASENEVFKKYLATWEVFDIREYTEGYNHNVFHEHMSQGFILQIEFPTEISSLFLSGLFSKVQLDETDFSFHHIILSLKEGQEGNLYFVNTVTNEVYQGLLKQNNMGNLKDYLLAENLSKTSVSPFSFGEARTLYLPTESFSLGKTTFLTDALDSEQFKDALFSNPKYAKRSGEDGAIFYTDGTRLLKENSLNASFIYINPVNVDVKNQASQRFQFESFNYVNSHSGFTGDYYLSDVLEDNHQVVFRMHHNQLPIFGKNLSSTIQVRWGLDESLSYIHPAYKLSYQVEKETISVEMDSGAVVYSKLSANPNIDMNLVENLRTAYIIEREGSFGQLIYLHPVWVVLYNGKWVNLQDLAEKDGGDLVGLE